MIVKVIYCPSMLIPVTTGSDDASQENRDEGKIQTVSRNPFGNEIIVDSVWFQTGQCTIK